MEGRKKSFIRADSFLKMQGPERSPLRVETARFESTLDRGIARVDLRGKAPDAATAGMIDQPVQQRSAYASVPP